MDDTLRSWVEETAGGRITAMTRPPAGGSRELYFVDVERDDGATVSLVLRCEGGGSFSGTEIAPAKEAVVYRALAEHAGARAARRRCRSRRRGAVDGARPRHRRPHRGRRRRARRDHGVVRRRAGGAAQPRRRHPHARRLRTAEQPRRPGAARPRDVGEARRRRRAGPRSPRALRRRVAPRPPARRRRPHRARPGRHRPGELRVREREGHRHRRLGVRAPRRPDGRLGLARHADAATPTSPGCRSATHGRPASRSTTIGSATTAPPSTTGAR